jgi:hypothetical protein
MTERKRMEEGRIKPRRGRKVDHASEGVQHEIYHEAKYVCLDRVIIPQKTDGPMSLL